MRVSMQPEKVTSIAERYPELNTGWLLTGEGDMLKNSEQDSKIVHSSSVPYEFVQAMIDERKRHDEMNAELIRQNGELIDILQERKKTDARNARASDFHFPRVEAAASVHLSTFWMNVLALAIA